MCNDDTPVSLLVMSAENDFQIKLLNANLQDIAKQLSYLNDNLKSQNKETNENLKELISFLYNFSLNVSVTNADIKKLNKIIEEYCGTHENRKY